MKIAVVGSYGVGLTMWTATIPAAGETVSGGKFSSGHGGKGSNQAVGAQRLGAEVSFLTAIGDDLHGREALMFWSDEGVDASSVKIVESPTMTGFILVEEGGENRIIIAPGALAELTVEDVIAFTDSITDADMVVVSLEIPLEAALEALRIASDAGIPTLLNPAPAVPIPAHAWDWIDYATPNEGELRILLNATDPRDSVLSLAQRLFDETHTVVIATRGEAGAVIVDSNGLQEVPATEATAVVDTTGAGDSFTAALAVALVEGRPVTDAARFAAAAAAITVATAEVIPALPYRSDLPA